MKPAMVIAVGTACCIALAGCYCSHTRPADAGIDGSVPDAPIDRDVDARVDAADAASARCRVGCAVPEIVATQELHELEGLLDIAWNGSSLGVLARRYYYAGADVNPEYALVLIDLAAGTIRVSDTADAVRTTSQLIGGGLHARDGAWIATVLRTDAIGPRAPIQAMVGAARWDADGALLWQDGELAMFPETLVSCDCPHRGAAFGRGATSIAAIAHGDAVWAVRLGWGVVPTVGDVTRLATLPLDVPGSTPLDGVVLSDDAVVVAGGGFGGGLERRDGFVVAGSIDEAPLTSSPSAGASFDPPPRVEGAPDGDRFYVFRRASNTVDLGASELRAEVRSTSGAPIDELSLPLRDGLVPLEIASYVTDEGAGVVWADRDGGLHVLPRVDVGTLLDCAHDIDAPPVATLPRGLDTGAPAYGARSLLAAADDDGVLVVALEPGPTLTVLRLGGCDIVAGR